MEKEIEALDERLKNDRSWLATCERVDRKLLSESLNSSATLFSFFAHEEHYTDQTLQMAWRNLETQILYFFRELDWTGVSQIMGEVGPEYLREFSFRNATQFRRYEEGLLKDLNIPEVAWERFWALLDDNKGDWLAEVSAMEPPYSLYRHLSDRVIRTFRAGPGTYEHLSPFKWWKPVVAGLGAVMGIADGVFVLPTGGIAITSFAASVVASVATAIDFPEKKA